jgi:hypothetical protein
MKTKLITVEFEKRLNKALDEYDRITQNRGKFRVGSQLDFEKKEFVNLIIDVCEQFKIDYPITKKMNLKELSEKIKDLTIDEIAQLSAYGVDVSIRQVATDTTTDPPGSTTPPPPKS